MAIFLFYINIALEIDMPAFADDVAILKEREMEVMAVLEEIVTWMIFLHLQNVNQFKGSKITCDE